MNFAKVLEIGAQEIVSEYQDVAETLIASYELGKCNHSIKSFLPYYEVNEACTYVNKNCFDVEVSSIVKEIKEILFGEDEMNELNVSLAISKISSEESCPIGYSEEYFDYKDISKKTIQCGYSSAFIEALEKENMIKVVKKITSVRDADFINRFVIEGIAI